VAAGAGGLVGTGVGGNGVWVGAGPQAATMDRTRVNARTKRTNLFIFFSFRNFSAAQIALLDLASQQTSGSTDPLQAFVGY
jgi:hypothetical protein